MWLIRSLSQLWQNLSHQQVTVGVLFGAVSMYVAYLTHQRGRCVSIRGKRIVVTGCDSGFGLLTLTQLVQEGAVVLACVYTAEGSNRAIAAGAMHVLRLDLTNSKDLEAGCQEIIKVSEGDLFAVVHNAGTVTAGMIDFQTMDNYRRCMEVNFFAIVAMNSYLLPLLKRRSQDGTSKRVVIVSSVDGLVSLPGNAPYDASKFAIEGYADTLRTEQSFWNICVSVINPATMKTPLALGFFETTRTTYCAKAREDLNPDSRWKKEWSESWLDQYVNTNKNGLEQIAQEPCIVAQDIMHSLKAVSPKLRYLSGFFAKTLFYFLWCAPETVSFAFKRATINPGPSIVE